MEDAQILAELNELVKLNKKEEFDRVILEKAAYPYLYHLSEIRQNLVDWLTLTKDMRVLERNAECGALTGTLLTHAGEVDCIVPGEEQAAIIRERCKENENRLSVILEDAFLAGLAPAPERKYDVILITGSFFRYNGELDVYKGMLKDGGRLLIADANRIGMKYLAGCQEEYRGGYFCGVEGYAAGDASDGMESPDPGGQLDGVGGRERGTAAAGAESRGSGVCPDSAARCYTKKEYREILEDAGFCGLKFYYPYPDFKFPSVIYSDECLPGKGELADNRRNFDRDRYQLFDERLAFDTFVEEGLFGEFANSFLIEAVKDRAEAESFWAGQRVVYSKFSNERAARFGIRTDILQRPDGTRQVRKIALKRAGNGHIEHICHAFELLCGVYGEETIKICPCEKAGDAVYFPFLQGKTLQREMEQCVKRGDMEAIERILKEYIRRVQASGKTVAFQKTEDFVRVFGDVPVEPETLCVSAGDIDLIFSNILLGEGEPWAEATVWNIIDYEWTFAFPVPKAFLLYRALYFAYYQILSRTKWQLPMLLALAQITPEQEQVFLQMEENFQDYLGKGALPVRNMQRGMGTNIWRLGQTQQGSETDSGRIAEEEWLKVRRLKYHIDRQEYQDGSMIVSGWAFAQARDGRYLPVNIRVKNTKGERLPAELTRHMRPDVAAAFGIRGVSRPEWGFDCVWLAPGKDEWSLCFSLGACEKNYGAAVKMRQGRRG